MPSGEHFLIGDAAPQGVSYPICNEYESDWLPADNVVSHHSLLGSHVLSLSRRRNYCVSTRL